MSTVPTYRGEVDASQLGHTLIHEHLFVRHAELELNQIGEAWDRGAAVEGAIQDLEDLHALGVRTIVDLTVPGIGRDVHLVSEVASRTHINLVAATGWYTPSSLPIYFAYHGPERAIPGPDPLVELFRRDLTEGIQGTGIRAGVLKIVTDEPGFTPDVSRILDAAAEVHSETQATIMTHSRPASRNGLEQLTRLAERGVDLRRVVVGHSGDTDDIDYLRALMEHGATVGLDRFGMEHVLSDERRTHTLVALLEMGYSDRIVLSHDAAFFSHITPPSWRRTSAPRWRMDTLARYILPSLRTSGISEGTIARLMVENPARLLGTSRQ